MTDSLFGWKQRGTWYLSKMLSKETLDTLPWTNQRKEMVPARELSANRQRAYDGR